MLTVKIVNDGTGTPEVANYRYQVLINETVIESGEIKKHHRRAGWQTLLLDLVDVSTKKQLEEIIGLTETK